MRKISALLILVIIMTTASIGCDKKEVIVQGIQLEEVLNTVDYIVNIRYNGVDNIDYEGLKLVLDDYTYNNIEEQFNRDITNYISVEKQYREAENAFENYKKRLLEDTVASKEKVENQLENEEELIENEEELIEGDPGESLSDYELMLDNIYNVEGELMWESITLEEAEQKTGSEIEEFIILRQSALDSFSNKGKENREDKEEKERIEKEQLEDSKLPNQIMGNQTENTELSLDLSDFNTDSRIKTVGEERVIMLDDVYNDVGKLEFEIYGINYSIDITDLKKPYSYCRGNEIYKLERVYYAMYDNSTVYITYSSIDEVNNKTESIEIEVRIIDNKINIADIESVTTTKY